MVPRKTVYLLLGALILLSIILRYPLVEHERFQTDSYFVHLLSKSIVDEGHAPWTFNSLSYFGYYPFSYPSGVPFFLAGISTLTGLSMELSVLVMNMGLAVLFCVAVFVLARQFHIKNEYALLATLFAIVASRFVDSSYWVASARAPLVIVFVLIAFVSFRAASMRRRSYYAILAIFVATAFVIHHMAVLLVLFGAGFILARVESEYLLPRIKRKKRVAAIGANVLLLAFVCLIAFGMFDYFRELTSSTFEDSDFLDLGYPFLSILGNTAASYTNQIGFILVIAIIGIPSVLRKAHLRDNSLFLITLLIAFVPMIGSSLYISIVLAPFVALLGTKWLAQLMQSKRKLVAMSLVVLLIGISILLPFWSTNRWNGAPYLSGDKIEVADARFNDATYLRVTYGKQDALANTYVLTLEMHALTDARFLGSGIMLTLNGEITPADIRENVGWSHREFPTDMYIWFEYRNEPSVDSYIYRLMIRGLNWSSMLDEEAEYWSNHQKLLVTVDNNWPHSSVSQYGVLEGKLLTQLRSATFDGTTFESYVVYQSQSTTLYLLNKNIS